MGTSSSLKTLKGLRPINSSNFLIVIWFRPSATSLNRVAPSVLKVDLQRTRASSLNTRCAHGKTENRCPPQRVIPGWAEAEDHLSRWLQEQVHCAQDSSGICEMFEGIERNDNVCKLLRLRREKAGVLNASAERLLSRSLQKIITNINADNSLGS